MVGFVLAALLCSASLDGGVSVQRIFRPAPALRGNVNVIPAATWLGAVAETNNRQSGGTNGNTAMSQSGSRGEVQISVFAKFVRQTAKERGVSISRAADMLYDAGVRGYDCGPDEEDLDELAATRLRPVSFYYRPDWLGRGMHDWSTYYADRTQPSECIAMAKKYGIPRIMVLPPDFTDGKENEAEFREILAKYKGFVAEAGKEGISVTVEDYNWTRNCCSYSKYLKRLLTEIPDLRLALDSGNLYLAGRGDDILELMDFAKGRIGHVHLKDPADSTGCSYVTLGLGVVPNERIVKSVAAAGYEGWYTLENLVGDTYNDAVRQAALVKAWLRAVSVDSEHPGFAELPKIKGRDFVLGDASGGTVDRLCEEYTFHLADAKGAKTLLRDDL